MTRLTRRLITAAITLLVALLPLGIASPAAAIEVNPTSIDFGTVAVGSTHTVPIQVTLSDGHRVQGYSITSNGYLAPGFGSCTSERVGPDTCTARITFAPAATGQRDGQIRFTECPTFGACVQSGPIVVTGTAIDAPLAVNVSASTANGTYKIGDILTVTVVFDRAVVVDATAGTPTVQLETGTVDRAASYVAGSGTNTLLFAYTVQTGDTSADLDYTGPGALTLNGALFNDVAYTVALPAPGQIGSLAANKALVVDGVRPTAATPTLSDTHLTVGETAQLQVVFTEPVTGLTLADLTATAGTLTGLTTSDSLTWTATLTPPAGAASTGNTVTVDATGVTDAAGNIGAGTATSAPYTVDTVIPAPADTTPPTSQATGPATVTAPTWTVSYTAADTETGVASVDLYAHTPGNPGYTKVATDSTDRDGKFTYTAAAGDGSYAFYTVATDAAGNTEATPATPDVTTTLTTPVPDTTAPTLRPRMGAEPVRFDLSEQRTLPLRVRVNERASVKVKIRSGGELVRAWKWRHGVRGLVEQMWNGRADGVRVPPGRYRVVFVAVDRAGNRATAAVRIRVTS